MQKEITTIVYLNAADKYWLGERLHAARLLCGLDIPATARLLSLSQAQIMAIETGSQGPFMHIAHYVQCVQYFAESMNTSQSIEVLHWLAKMEEANAVQVTVSSQMMRVNKKTQPRLANDAVASGKGGRSKRLSSMGTSFALIALGFLVTLPLMRDVDHAENNVSAQQVALQETVALVPLNTEEPAPRPMVETNAAVNTEAVVPNEAERTNVMHAAKVTVSAAVASSTKKLNLQFTAPCWVQITFHDGRVTDRLYETAEALDLDLRKTASLVIGNVSGATALTESGSFVDFNSFVVEGNVARLTEKDLVRLSARGDQADSAL